jgi:hypothetical protein
MTVTKAAAGGAGPCVDGGGGAYEAWRRQSLRARYAYGFVFFATNLLAWFVRDYGARALRGLHRGFFLLPSSSENPALALVAGSRKAAFMSLNFDLQMCPSAEQETPSASSPEECFG